MISDYAHFEDVVSFDATFRINNKSGSLVSSLDSIILNKQWFSMLLLCMILGSILKQYKQIKILQ